MYPFRQRKKWQEGTYMKLASKEVFATFVFTGEDMQAMRMGKPFNTRKMTQRKLARIAEVSQTFISHLVTGVRTSCKPETAERIADALGVEVTVLFVPEIASNTCEKAA